MSENKSTRRKFIQFLGLSASATLVNTNVFAGFASHEEIKKLNPQQQEFMVRYGKWMDKFNEVARIQKATPDNKENNNKMTHLAKQAHEMKPELAEFMKDQTFSLIFLSSIERMNKEA